MGYYIDLSLITLNEHKNRILNEYQIPSFRRLRADIDNHFEQFKHLGITNIEELKSLLKSKAHDRIVSEQTNIPEQYIATLRREINSHMPPARKLVDFKTVSIALKQKLKLRAINTTVDLYNYLIAFNELTDIQKDLHESAEDIIYLAKLCDLSRIRYVSPIFAITLAYTEFNTIMKIQNADADKLLAQMQDVNQKFNFYKGNVGINDIHFLIQDSQKLTTDFQFINN